MNLKKFKKFILAVNLLALILAYPLYMGSKWLQANLIGEISESLTMSGIEPVRTLTSKDKLNLELYDNSSNKDQSGYLEKLINEQIKSAQKEIIIAMYSFDLESIKEELLQAKRRGVEVRLLFTYVNKPSFSTFWGESNQEIEPIYIGENNLNSNYSMHHKFILIDPNSTNAKLLTGSWNWTHLQENLDPSIILKTTNKEIIDSFYLEAKRLINGANGFNKFRLNDYRPWTDLINFPDQESVEIWFSPGREKYSILNRIIGMINGAQKEIVLGNTIVDSEEVAKALIKKAHQGIKVKVMLDQLNISAPDSIYKYLSKKKEIDHLENLEIILGGENNVNTKGEYSIYHNHYLIVDRQAVLTGSANWSYGGEFLNDENFLVIYSEKAAQLFMNNFEQYENYLNAKK